ncbi:hypothetical protein [Streptomyces sp. CB03234]|nr:hypothetical protein [Streptomyces sp. CB03234]
MYERSWRAFQAGSRMHARLDGGGVARELIAAVPVWAREQGCTRV